MTDPRPRHVPTGLAEMRYWLRPQLPESQMGSHVLTQWLRGHEHDVMEITIFPLSTGDAAALDARDDGGSR